MLNRLFLRRKYQSVAASLYVAIMAQARRPHFFSQWAVPDTLDGRFEMLVVHMFLVIRRVKGLGESGRQVAQYLFNQMFTDMDQALREAGVSDVAVPKRIKEMVSAFYGRANQYEVALGEADNVALVQVIERNVFPGDGLGDDGAGQSGDAAALGAYIRRIIDELAGQDDQALIEGRVAFAHPQGDVGGPLAQARTP